MRLMELQVFSIQMIILNQFTFIKFIMPVKIEFININYIF